MDSINNSTTDLRRTWANTETRNILKLKLKHKTIVKEATGKATTAKFRTLLRNT